MIIIVFKKDNEIKRVGLYEKATMKWLKWLPKKNYKMFAQVHHLEIEEMEE